MNWVQRRVPPLRGGESLLFPSVLQTDGPHRGPEFGATNTCDGRNNIAQAHAPFVMLQMDGTPPGHCIRRNKHMRRQEQYRTGPHPIRDAPFVLLRTDGPHRGPEFGATNTCDGRNNIAQAHAPEGRPVCNATDGWDPTGTLHSAQQTHAKAGTISHRPAPHRSAPFVLLRTDGPHRGPAFGATNTCDGRNNIAQAHAPFVMLQTDGPHRDPAFGATSACSGRNNIAQARTPEERPVCIATDGWGPPGPCLRRNKRMQGQEQYRTGPRPRGAPRLYCYRRMGPTGTLHSAQQTHAAAGTISHWPTPHRDAPFVLLRTDGPHRGPEFGATNACKGRNNIAQAHAPEGRPVCSTGTTIHLLRPVGAQPFGWPAIVHKFAPLSFPKFPTLATLSKKNDPQGNRRQDI